MYCLRLHDLVFILERVLSTFLLHKYLFLYGVGKKNIVTIPFLVVVRFTSRSSSLSIVWLWSSM